MITSFKCPCGNTDPRKAREYHGCLGYEAIICTNCGRLHDHFGISEPNDFTKEFLTK